MDKNFQHLTERQNEDGEIVIEASPKTPLKTKTKSRFFFVRHWALIVIIIASTATAGLLINMFYDVDLVGYNHPFVIKRKTPPVYYSVLSGQKLEDQSQVNRAITAIMIENSGAARPQSGLASAELVFEAIAEGGITRFLALYQTSQPQLIGPVRSVRPYYVSWVAPFQASIAHVGGSQKALAEIRNGKYRDIDQFLNTGAYWRATDRYAPHNVYTSFERLNKLNQDKGYTSSQPDMFLRQDAEPVENANAKRIDIKISSAFYNSFYTYNPSDNNYTRHQNGAVHNDREAGAIKTDVVIAMHVSEKKVMEDGYREDIETIGSGKAHIFQNGTVIEAIWRKPEQFKQVRFYDAEGKEIAINRGKVWISAVPNNRESVSWQ